MILTCPACGTQYVVKDGAIPPHGRQVRCASCKHSWHQDPEQSDFAEDGETLAEAAAIDPSSGPEAEERAYQEAALAADASGAEEPDEPPGDLPPLDDDGAARPEEGPADTVEPPTEAVVEEDPVASMPTAD